MIVTRILYSDHLNQGKLEDLKEQARRLGSVRSEVWQSFGSIAGVGLRDRTIRDQWMKEKRQFKVSANAWKETLRDSIGDIKANKESSKLLVKQAIRRHTKDSQEQKRLYTALKFTQWSKDPYLSRMMRKHNPRGYNHIHNQIVVRSDNYTVFELGGRIWLKIPSLTKGKPIAIPLKTKKVTIKGTLRLILRDGKVEVHYTKEAKQGTCGTQEIGVDKGYTEVLIDSDGVHYGKGLGALLSKESDYLKDKYIKRNKIKGVIDKLRKKGNHSKANKIVKKNLGRVKLDKRSKNKKQVIRTLTFDAVHRVVDKAGLIACEDLTAPIKSKSFGKNVNRKLSSWTKGIIAEALENVSQRRGSTLAYQCCAYTSQMDSKTGLLEGKRVGDKFYHANGDGVTQADHNAAINVLARLYDDEIHRYMPYNEVRQLLLERTNRHRLRLSNQDSSCL